jgi:HPt (histidine-containing phosphotransfer) domain-containing protein
MISETTINMNRLAAAPSRGTHADKPSPDHPMRKIFLMVGIAIAIFMAFTAYSIHNAAQGRARLSAIRDLYFPVLQRSDANLIRLDKMEEQYLQTVETGDPDLLDKAREIGEVADRTFGEISQLYPARAAEVATLRADLKTYETLAEKAINAFLAHTDEDKAPLTGAMNRALANLKKELKAFRDSSYSNFTDTLSESQHDAKEGSLLGLTIGAMNIGFMAVLVYFIRNNMRMMNLIAEQNATLELRVADRTAELSRKNADISAMLQNMKLGVATIVSGNRVHPEYSAYLRTIFERDDFAGMDLMDALFAKSTLGVDVKDQVAVALSATLGEDSMMYDFNGHLLVGEMAIETDHGATKLLQLDWSPILNDSGQVDKMLLITQDVTHLRALELEAAQQKDEMDLIAKIIRVAAGKFDEFIGSSQRLLAECRDLVGSTRERDGEAIDSLFRNMHTIKGNARTYDFTHITNAAHIAEQTYDRLRKDPSAVWDPTALRQDLDAVAAAVTRYAGVNDDTLGRKGRAGELVNSRGAFVSLEDLSSVQTLAAALPSLAMEPAVAKLKEAIGRLGMVPLSRLVSAVADSLPALARSIGKPEPSIEGDFAGVLLSPRFSEALKASLVHIVRNSMDHGIEPENERIAAGKAPAGTLRFACEPCESGMLLRIGDDGRGLALQRLYAKGVAEGLFGAGEQPTAEVVAALIFRAGLSTAEQLTDISGRGVGMDAVRTFLGKEGADIRIELKSPHASGPFDFTPFNFVITIPQSCYAV